MLPSSRVVRTAALAALLLPLLGCGGGSSVYDVYGTVTFDGKPVPAGRVYFTPDLAQKNDGPQGFAEIHDGQFDSRQGGRGTVSGPVVIRVEGYEKGPDARSVGKRLFLDYEIKRDLPKVASAQTLEVPASAGKNVPQGSGPGP
jgi:hypothetical protein